MIQNFLNFDMNFLSQMSRIIIEFFKWIIFGVGRRILELSEFFSWSFFNNKRIFPYLKDDFGYLWII